MTNANVAAKVETLTYQTPLVRHGREASCGCVTQVILGYSTTAIAKKKSGTVRSSTGSHLTVLGLDSDYETRFAATSKTSSSEFPTDQNVVAETGSPVGLASPLTASTNSLVSNFE